MPTFVETIPHLLTSPQWKGQPLWLLNLFELKRGPDGEVTAAAEASFRAYLSSAQRHTAVITNTPADGSRWFQTARMVSLNAFSCFPKTHGVWDAVVMFEYDSPEELSKLVLSSKEYKEVAKPREEAEARMTQIAVKPLPINMKPGASDPAVRERVREAADAHWAASLPDLQKQTGDETQIISPDLADLVSLFEGRARVKPDSSFIALNLLAFKRSPEEPDGRTSWMQYITAVEDIIGTSMPGCGSRLEGTCTPCMTLNGEQEWDAVAMFQYPDLKAYAGLTEQPGYASGDCKGMREKGLLYQGLVLVEPQLMNGCAEGSFRVSDDGNSEGLSTPPAPVSFVGTRAKL